MALIDEFQDISPQIVQWLQALHRGLARQGEAVSLMAIGDDWQSIYGWRGSSPELFMDFDRHFPSKGKTKKSTVLTLATNYRSIEPILRDGEAVLEGVAFKQAKDLLLASARTLVAAAGTDWHRQHRAHYHLGRAHLQAGDPSSTLAQVSELMTIEDAHGAGPVERFFTAALACRAQIVRGQKKVAAAAFEACQDYAKRTNGDQGVLKALAELDKQMHPGA